MLPLKLKPEPVDPITRVLLLSELLETVFDVKFAIPSL
jgi:hypothetical protein